MSTLPPPSTVPFAAPPLSFVVGFQAEEGAGGEDGQQSNGGGGGSKKPAAPKEEDSEFVRQAMNAAKDIQDQIANGVRTIDIPAVRKGGMKGGREGGEGERRRGGVRACMRSFVRSCLRACAVVSFGFDV